MNTKHIFLASALAASALMTTSVAQTSWTRHLAAITQRQLIILRMLL